MIVHIICDKSYYDDPIPLPDHPAYTDKAVALKWIADNQEYNGQYLVLDFEVK